MNTPTHIIVSLAVFAEPGERKRNLIVLTGAIIPDVFIYVLSAWALATGQFNGELWSVTYWQEPWQTLGALSNSVPLALLLLIISLWRDWQLLKVIALVLLIHALMDIPLHADDAHRHFWPISDWRFMSPVSYWDRDYHGWLGSLFDLTCLIVGAGLLWRRFPALWVRLALAVTVLFCTLLFIAALVWAASHS